MPAREFSQLRVSLSSGNLRATLVQYPLLMAELDAIRKLRPTGGLMLRRDGSSLPWFGKGEIRTQVQRISKKIILAAGLRPELTFTSFGCHGGTTEASASGLAETQLMQKDQ